MKKRHKYLGSPLIYFGLFFIAMVIYLPAGYITDAAHSLLAEELPKLVKSYNEITSPDEYVIQLKILTAINVTLTLFVLNYLSLLLDNKRSEFILSKTDGRFRMSDGFRLYSREVWKSDVITAILPPVCLFPPAYFIPEKILDYGVELPLFLEIKMLAAYPPLECIILCSLISLVTRIAASPLALRKLRSSWLSGSL